MSFLSPYHVIMFNVYSLVHCLIMFTGVSCQVISLCVFIDLFHIPLPYLVPCTAVC